MGKTYDELLSHINTLTVIDTHEHLPTFEKQRGQDSDIISEYTTHYFSCDLISAGLSSTELNRIHSAKMPITEKWAALAPYWDAARNTGYGQALDIAVQGLYGLPELNADTIEAADAAFRAARAAGNWYDNVLKDKCKIAISINDSWQMDNDAAYFVGAYNVNQLIVPGGVEHMSARVREAGLGALTLESWCAFAELQMKMAFEKGAGVLKCSLAYDRPLYFAQRTTAEAEAALCECLNGKSFDRHVGCVDRSVDVRFQDYMCHYICRFAQRQGWTMQWHTGIQEGNGNMLEYTRPELLTNLFLAYPALRFDLFHISYPYSMVAGALCKNFQNVYLDMCWAHIISPTASVRALTEWLDAVPANKISAFGGDYCFPDAVYGHVTLARRNVAKALAIKVDEDGWRMERAKQVAGWLFYDNPLEIFRLKERLSVT